MSLIGWRQTGLRITYNLADQNLFESKSVGIYNVGIYNVSTQLLQGMLDSSRVERVTLLANDGLKCFHPKMAIRRANDACKGKFGQFAWNQRGVYKAAAEAGNSWLFLPKGFSSFMAKPPCYTAAYVHDALFSYYASRGMKAFPLWERIYFGLSLAATLRRADIIFTNSEFSRREILRLAQGLKLKEPLVTVAGIGFHRSPIAPRAKENKIVILASPWPHKQTRMAVEYLYRWADEEQQDQEVVWIGSFPKGLEMPKLRGWKQFPRMDEERYRETIRSARVLVYFSDYEGFGMPPVEAVHAGACPVFSAIPATREVMKGTGFSFQNEDYPSFLQALRKGMACPTAAIQAWSDQLAEVHIGRRSADA